MSFCEKDCGHRDDSYNSGGDTGRSPPSPRGWMTLDTTKGEQCTRVKHDGRWVRPATSTTCFPGSASCICQKTQNHAPYSRHRYSQQNIHFKPRFVREKRLLDYHRRGNSQLRKLLRTLLRFPEKVECMTSSTEPLLDDIAFSTNQLWLKMLKKMEKPPNLERNHGWIKDAPDQSNFETIRFREHTW